MTNSQFPTNPLIRSIKVGNLVIGGGAPVVVQSMCSTDTCDVRATLAQIQRLAKAGCELVRVAVPNKKASQSLYQIVKESPLPVVADIHFDYRLALEAIKVGVAKVRINPGNIGSQERLKRVIDAAGARQIPIRIGINSGSLPEDILERDNFIVTPQGMVESAMREIELLDKQNFKDIIVSLKASDIKTTIEANRLFRAKSDIPLHLGITEAGLKGYGSVKSAIGIGVLLMEGIGETIRVSIAAEPEEEVKVCWWILEATGVRRMSPELVVCPTCGRLEIALVPLAKKVERILKGVKKPIKVAVMGCVVNGPGECREADIGVVGGKGKGLIVRKGEIVKSVSEKDIIAEFKSELKKLLNQLE